MKRTSLLFSSVSFSALAFPALSLELGGGYVQDRIGSCTVEVFSDSQSMAVGIDQIYVPNGQIFGQDQIISGLRQSISAEALAACGIENVISVSQDGIDGHLSEDDFYGFEYTVADDDGVRTYRYGFLGTSGSVLVSGLVTDAEVPPQVTAPSHLTVREGQSVSIPLVVTTAFPDEVSVTWSVSSPAAELLNQSSSGVVLVAPLLGGDVEVETIKVTVEVSGRSTSASQDIQIQVFSNQSEIPVEDPEAPVEPEEPEGPEEPEIDQTILLERERIEKQTILKAAANERARLQLSYQPSIRSLSDASRTLLAQGIHLSSNDGEFELSPVHSGAFWTYLRGAYGEADTSSSSYMLGALGADLISLGSTSLGLMLQFDSFKREQGSTHFDGNGWMAGAYLYGEIIPSVFWYEAMWLQGKSSNTVGLSASDNEKVTSERKLASLKIGGEVEAEAFTLLPFFMISRLQDISEAYTSSSGATIPSTPTTLFEYSSAIDVVLPIQVSRGTLDVTMGLQATSLKQDEHSSPANGSMYRASIGLNRRITERDSLSATLDYSNFSSGKAEYIGVSANYSLNF